MSLRFYSLDQPSPALFDVRGVRDATDLARFGGLAGIQSRDLWKTSSKNYMLLFMQKGSPRKDEDPLAMVTKIHLHYSCQTGMFDQSWTDRFWS